MSGIITRTLTLEEFLKLPETKPASEYINGCVLYLAQLCHKLILQKCVIS